MDLGGVILFEVVEGRVVIAGGRVVVVGGRAATSKKCILSNFFLT